MSRVAIKKAVLHWAMDRSGLTMEELQRRFPNARQWDTGESQPTLRQVEALARLTLTPLGFLFLEEPPQESLPLPFFRTLGDQALPGPSPDLLDTLHAMQQRQEWMREYLIEQGQEPLSFVRCAQPESAPAVVADSIRGALKLDERWAAARPTWTNALRFLRETMEDTGILVVSNGVVGNNTHRRLDPEEFRGFVLVDEYAPLVFVNAADGKAAQMFTLAHELAHVFFGSSAAFDLREMQPADDPTEQACNRVAAEFLVPEGELRQLWPSIRAGFDPFENIARRFKVSSLVGARRALDLGLITKAGFLSFYNEYQKQAWRAAAQASEGGDFYATQNLRVGRRFAAAVARAAREGRLLYSEAYKLTGLHGKTFDHYVASLQIQEPR
jgi:Zn-dependent peptidase ImmA (M78 family)